VHYTGRLDDGRVFDSSKEREPLELTVGQGRVIPGVEEAIVQMEPGEERAVTVPADRAFGPRRPELMLSVDRTEIPEHIQPTVGQTLQVQHQDGQVAEVRVAEVSDSQVTLDANHPLAGHDLTFDLELVEIREGKSLCKPVYYRLPTGQWRVTDARDDWRDDGITYPESNLGDQYFDNEEDAWAACQARLSRSRPER
jgi:peptidylprolyl isomerase